MEMFNHRSTHVYMISWHRKHSSTDPGVADAVRKNDDAMGVNE